MCEETKAEVKKLLWCYLKTPEDQKVADLKDYLTRQQIPLDKLRHAFKGECDETHYRAIDAVTKITVSAIEKTRNKDAA